MKIQDFLFIGLFLIFLFKRDTQITVLAGIIFLLASMPLFYFWIFFTAERFTWYAVAFFLASVFFQLKQIRNN